MSTWADIDRYLTALHIRIGTPTIGQTTGGIHVPGSYHYAGMARDYGSMTSDMRAIWDALLPFAQGPNHQLVELFGPWGAWKAGRDIEYVGGHTDHVHAAIAPNGVLKASQPIPAARERKPCLIRLPYAPWWVATARATAARGAESTTSDGGDGATP